MCCRCSRPARRPRHCSHHAPPCATCHLSCPCRAPCFHLPHHATCVRADLPVLPLACSCPLPCQSVLRAILRVPPAPRRPAVPALDLRLLMCVSDVPASEPIGFMCRLHASAHARPYYPCACPMLHATPPARTCTRAGMQRRARARHDRPPRMPSHSPLACHACHRAGA